MLLACGSNGRGQLGVGHEEDLHDWAPVPLPLTGHISVASGGNHTVIVEHGTGRAHISKDGTFVPIDHPHDNKWVLCAAGWAFTVLVDEQSGVWVSGSGSKGELGLGPQRDAAELARIDWRPPADIFSIKCGLAHTVACLSDGSLWGWGASRKGQLNLMAAVVDRPMLVMDSTTTYSTDNSYACGRDFTAVLHSGRLQILGNTRLFGSASIDAARDTKVLAGWSSVVLLPSVRAFGNNSHEQLNAPDHADAVALGSEHGLYRVKAAVKSWGWGEHGNCPPEREFDGEVTLFAGCATSFVYCT